MWLVRRRKERECVWLVRRRSVCVEEEVGKGNQERWGKMASKTRREVML